MPCSQLRRRRLFPWLAPPIIVQLESEGVSVQSLSLSQQLVAIAHFALIRHVTANQRADDGSVAKGSACDDMTGVLGVHGVKVEFRYTGSARRSYKET